MNDIPIKFSRRCAFRCGRSFLSSVFVSFPLAQINLTAEALIVKIGFGSFVCKEYVFRKADISSFGLRRRVIADGIQVFHRMPDMPFFVVVYMIHAKEILKHFNLWLGDTAQGETEVFREGIVPNKCIHGD